jgi:hypothetical protein
VSGIGKTLVQLLNIAIEFCIVGNSRENPGGNFISVIGDSDSRRMGQRASGWNNADAPGYPIVDDESCRGVQLTVGSAIRALDFPSSTAKSKSLNVASRWPER